ncbi:MAG: hypothetical protein ABSC94_14115 [Polyangiaceae bacterium]
MAALASALAARGAVLKTEVTKRAGRGRALEIFDALVAAGFEVGARFVRRPLEAQIEERLVRGPMSLRGADKVLHGASSLEVARAARRLVERGRARLVLRPTGLHLASLTAPVLDDRAQKRLLLAITELTKLLKQSAKAKTGVLGADIEAALESAVSRGPALPPTTTRDLGALLDQHREDSGLTFIPKLVRALGGASVRDALHAELLSGAHAGRLELRPESGMGRLSREDALFCVPGSHGMLLSWVRRIGEGS